MNKQLLKSWMAKFGDTQKTLASEIGISPSRFNAKLNSKGGAEFMQTEMSYIVERYHLTPDDISAIFFDSKVS